MSSTPNFKLIFQRSFSSKKSDIGACELVKPGDHITFLKDDTFMTRAVAAVNGLIITTIPFPNEKPFMFDRKEITQIIRPQGKK